MLSAATEKASDAPWAVRSLRVVTPEGERPAGIVVRGESIQAIVPWDEVREAAAPVIDYGDLVVMPGLVDAHVHINEPGRTEWEGFETATRAAAAGGVTTLVDMPLNSSPVTTTVPALQEKLAAAAGKLRVDCGFYGGVVPGNAAEIAPLLDAGVLGFKAFLCHSGIDDFPAARVDDVRAALRIATGVPLLAHAEIVAPLPADVQRNLAAAPHRYAAYLASRPRQWEHAAIRMLIDLCRETGGRVHIVHLASADALPLIKEARAAGLPLTVETCPHYLVFAAEEIPDGQTRYKCAPPIRERENRERLWQALRDGLIDTIGTDHSPAPPALKLADAGDLRNAWGGIASLQLGLAAIWTAARPRGIDLTKIAEWMCRNPARLVGLESRKGVLAAGHDADFAVFDPEHAWTVRGDELFHRHKLTPYDGMTLRGQIVATYLRGQKIFAEGAIVGDPLGRVVLRPGAPHV